MGDRKIWSMRESDLHSGPGLVVTASLERSAMGWPGGLLSVSYTNLRTGDQDTNTIVVPDLAEIEAAIRRFRETGR